MKLLGGLVLTALLLCCSAMHADTLYDVSGTVSFFGNDVCSGQCIETVNFTFQLDDQFTGQGWTMSVLPGATSSSSGPLAFAAWDFTSSFILPDVDGGYLGWGNADDSFAIATHCLGRAAGPCTPDLGLGGVVFECESAICAADFCTPQIAPLCPGFAGGGGIGVPSTLSATVTELGNSNVPEPSTWALLALGLSMFIPLRAIRLAAMWSAGACSRRLPPGLARACSSHPPRRANLPNWRLCLLAAVCFGCCRFFIAAQHQGPDAPLLRGVVV